MGEMRECFQEYGAEYEETMERFLNNKALYLRLLGRLFLDDNLRLLGDDLEAGNRANAFEAAHTLKGVTGNLGLMPLYEALCAIVEPLRVDEERADYPALYQAVQMEFQRAEEFWNTLKESE